ncbi:FAD-dependent oxidoreductase [Zavarzinia sp.]|uniref:FAD-dependent oxidoreductase n=1 Tax=Zavarzinia sp. TaxID=2027920 RepID=UPI003569C77B
MSAERIAGDVCVVGGGPAGLSAALAAREAGATVHLLDLFERPGGQYFMQPAAGAHGPAKRQIREGAALIERVRAAGVIIHGEAEVFGAYGDPVIFAGAGGRALTLRPRAVVLATGAHDRVAPFPGWTLPGVMTPGAAQRLVKLHGTLPGRRVVLAGSGPFLMVVAGQLRAAGCDVLRIVEAAPSPARLLAGIARHPGRWAEAARLLAPVAPLASRFRFGRLVTAAGGDGRVERVTIAPLGSDGLPLTAKAETIEGVDALLIGQGFRPQVEVARLFGCAIDFDQDAGGHHVRVDRASGATTVTGVFAAGEVTGVAGARPALAGGRIAGLSAARHAGRPASEGDLTAFEHALDFALMLRRAYRLPYAALGSLADAETLLCRCEEVSAGDVDSALAEGARDAAGIKLWTRAGMGPCQGRQCGFGLGLHLCAKAGIDPAAFGANPSRFPARPVPLSIVAEALSADEPPAAP